MRPAAINKDKTIYQVLSSEYRVQSTILERYASKTAMMEDCKVRKVSKDPKVSKDDLLLDRLCCWKLEVGIVNLEIN